MDLLDYYGDMSDTSASVDFRNLDDADEIDTLVGRLQSSSTKNFLVDFGDDDAYVAFNLFRPTVQELLETERPDRLTTRWINVWHPYHQKSLIGLLAKHYDFTPRMLGLMCSDPKEPSAVPIAASSSRHGEKLRKLWSKHSRSSAETDTERGLDELSEHSSISSHDSGAGGNLYHIVDDVWHYSSIDFGRRYIALGYNSIYGHKHAGTGTSDEESDEGADQPLPHCTRVWTWLIICNDNTIITINEDPFPYNNGRQSSFERRVLCETRRNLVNVFRSLSIIQPDPINARNPMNLLPLRHRIGSTLEESAHRSSGKPRYHQVYHTSRQQLTHAQTRPVSSSTTSSKTGTTATPSSLGKSRATAWSSPVSAKKCSPPQSSATSTASITSGKSSACCADTTRATTD